MRSKVKAIMATTRNNVIGVSGNIPWSIPSEQRHFKNLTSGGILIIGATSYENLPMRLAGHTYLVITRDSSSVKIREGDNVITCSSPKCALAVARKQYLPIWVVGGASIYECFYDDIDEWHISYIPVDKIDVLEGVINKVSFLKDLNKYPKDVIRNDGDFTYVVFDTSKQFRKLKESTIPETVVNWIRKYI